MTQACDPSDWAAYFARSHLGTSAGKVETTMNENEQRQILMFCAVFGLLLVTVVLLVALGSSGLIFHG